MKEYEIVAVLHDERHNGKRCAKYWAVESDPECERDSEYEIYDQWFCHELPKRISAVLNTASDDPENWGDKRGVFIVTLEKPVVFDDYGHVRDFKNIISIKAKDAPTDIKHRQHPITKICNDGGSIVYENEEAAEQEIVVDF